jgi:hypothetical protein
MFIVIVFEMAHLRNIHIGNQIAGGVCQKSEQTLKDILPRLIESFQDYMGECDISWTNKLNFENCFIKPDGGAFFLTYRGRRFCFLTIEDKYQGTNDTLYREGKNRQSTGNAIERVFKNINTSWHLFKDLPICPYVVFVAGCDFHHTETIIHRIGPASNFGRRPIIREVCADGRFDMSGVCDEIDIHKDQNREFGIFCVKAHKYDEHPNKTSMWTSEERLHVLEHVGKKAIKEILRHINNYERVCSTTDDNIPRE